MFLLVGKGEKGFFLMFSLYKNFVMWYILFFGYEIGVNVFVWLFYFDIWLVIVLIYCDNIVYGLVWLIMRGVFDIMGYCVVRFGL